MKKVKFLLLICLLGIITTGCVKFNVNMDIKKDKSMDFTIIYALDKSIFGDQGTLKEEDFEEAKKEGFTISKYSDGNMEGFTLTRKINNIDEVSTESDAEYNLSGLMSSDENAKYLFKVVKGDKKNTYYAKFKFDANDSGLNMNEGLEDDSLADEANEANGLENSEDPFANVDFEKMAASMDLSFNVTLPSSAISNNASKAEDNNKKLSWKLSSTNAQSIEFAFDLNNGNGNDNLVLYIGIGVIAILLVVVIVLALTKKKSDNVPANKEINNNPVNNQISEEKNN